MKLWKAYYLKRLRSTSMKSNGTKAHTKPTRKPARRPYRITFGRAERTDVFKNPAPPATKAAKPKVERRRAGRGGDGAPNGERPPDVIQPIATQSGVDLTEKVKELVT